MPDQSKRFKTNVACEADLDNMSRALRDALLKLRQYVVGTQSRVTTIVSGEGEAGTRAAPSQTQKHDADIGVRLDFGDKFAKDGKEFRRYKLQVNKQAENKTLKALAAKDSHQIVAEADMQVNPPPEDAAQAAEDFFDSLSEDLEAKGVK